MGKHTKTPWHIDTTSYANAHIVDKYGESILTFGDNAEYIVKCVNNHDALVELLKKLEKQSFQPSQELIEELQTALAQVEKG